MGYLFILLIVFFAVQKVLSLIKSYLFIFAFISFAFGDWSKKYCYNLCQRSNPKLGGWVSKSGNSDIDSI